jgi:hypothetical protein
MSKFLKLLNSVVLEQDLDIKNKDFPENTKEVEPVQVDSKETSALPTTKDLTIDFIKYKNLLKALREALFNSEKNNIEKQREISNIDIDDVDDPEKLKELENLLMGFLDQSETVVPASE